MKLIFSRNWLWALYGNEYFQDSNCDFNSNFCIWYYCLIPELHCLPFKSVLWMASTSSPIVHQWGSPEPGGFFNSCGYAWFLPLSWFCYFFLLNYLLSSQLLSKSHKIPFKSHLFYIAIILVYNELSFLQKII